MHYLLYGIIVALSVTIDMRLIYALFIVLLFCNKKKCTHNNETFFLSIAVASIILPDNYSTEACFLLYFFVSFVMESRGRIKKSRYSLLLGLFFFIAILSTILNCVPIVNIFFSIISFLPFAAFLIMLGNLGRKDYSGMYRLIDDILVIELMAMVMNFIVYHSSISDDWSCGTFFRGGGPQAQLFVISAFMLVLYFTQYWKSKRNWKSLLKAIGALVILLSTNCWTLCVFFALGIGLAYLFSLTPKRLFILLAGICCIPVVLYLVLNYAPGSVSAPLKSMLTDASYFRYRFYKAVVYKTTFVDIPSKDLLFGLVGNGVGYYNSRAALICTGHYVGFYNRLFIPSVSFYTENHILEYLQYAAMDGNSDYGSVLARPYSSILSLMGECGYMGMIIFALMFWAAMKNRRVEVKMLLCMWLCFCFVESYFEYTKILAMLYFCLVLVCSESAARSHDWEHKAVHAEVMELERAC